MDLKLDINELSRTAVEFGFPETPALKTHRLRICSAIRAGTPTAGLWKQYRRVAQEYYDTAADPIEHASFVAGYHILCAEIFFLVNRNVEGLEHLLRAIAIARHHGWTKHESWLRHLATDRGTAAERLQANARVLEEQGSLETARGAFQAAVDLYDRVERLVEVDPLLRETHEGVLELRLTECYLGLVRTDAPGRKTLEVEAVNAISRAGQHLRNGSGFTRYQDLLAITRKESWWRAALKRAH